MKCDFQVGDKIACVHTTGLTNRLGLPMPEVGKVYTVAGLSPNEGPIGHLPGWEVGVALAEINVVVPILEIRVVYPHCWFRKVERLGTESGMEILRKALDDVKAGKFKREKEDA